MKGLSRTEIIGNIGGEVKAGQLNNGTPVVNFNVAVNESYKDRDGNKKEKTSWVKISIFGTRGEALAPHLKTGMSVFAAGRIGTEAWVSENGEAKGALTLTLGDGRNDFLFLGGGRDGDGEAGTGDTDELFTHE